MAKLIAVTVVVTVWVVGLASVGAVFDSLATDVAAARAR